MTALSWALLALAAAGLAFGLWQWVSRRRTLRRLNAMLDRAIAGGFAEDRFDETELSALEGKLARFDLADAPMSGAFYFVCLKGNMFLKDWLEWIQ